MKEIWYVTASIVGDPEHEECFCGVFSSKEEPLNAIRALAGEDYYEGKYTEVCEDEGIYICTYATTEDYDGTIFEVRSFPFNRFENPCF